jgi:DNA-binding GntR family transcriptional regulator
LLSNTILDRLTIQRLTTAEQIAGALRDSILRGELRPGTALREAGLSVAFRVSRNTVREGLRLLEQDGLVTHNAHRGVTVSVLSPDDVRDIYTTRRHLEVLGIKALHGRPTGIDELHNANRDLARCVAVRDWAAAFDADLRFHTGVVAVLGSQRLRVFYEGVLRELRLEQLLFAPFATVGFPKSLVHHRRLVALLRKADLEACRTALLDHLRWAERMLLDLMAGPPQP